MIKGNYDFYLVEIQRKREEMIHLGLHLGLNNKQTIACSQELDALLNEYERCLQSSIEKPSFPMKKSMCLTLDRRSSMSIFLNKKTKLSPQK
ncbi:aspartyl-phosphate phosphatase Spo0E family protein [Falsibacillus albus]|uniref:Aspartyl-phosphate phosphatase Spo0E family protein n=1 Tax=Falsibacillus albus TaxID=2478915 RepID=A0A3L7K5F9_9BACI|nr:aspartyl-phosphate phosphatase Spo0E family protein [Falsibacillus albus]RLQ97519.1 aspartyl-phosphate phosphatase Spo0E family protein [Falsibacillus albus]